MKKKQIIYIIGLSLFMAYSVELLSQESKAVLEVDFSEDGTTKLITASLQEVVDDTTYVPVEYANITFGVQRTFSTLPIGEDYNFTDENGLVSVEFPNDMPGDSAGFVTIIVRLQDDGNYPDMEIREDIQWGIPTHLEYKENARSLAAAGVNAPISLLILVNSLIAAAWGIIFYILYKIYRVSRM